MKVKSLITAGCSFSMVPFGPFVTWPKHLSEELQCETLFLGHGGVGNGIISKRTINAVSNQLESGVDPENILVGIMWSGMHRAECYSTRNPNHTKIKLSDKMAGLDNPTKIDSNSPESNYYIMNIHWNDELSKNFTKYFHDNDGMAITTIEHILRVQWFLKLHNIKYFMSAYANDVFPEDKSTNSDIANLYKLIDFDNWLPLSNMRDFAQQTGIPFLAPDNLHPVTEHHKLMVDTILLPHLKSKGYI